MRPLIGVGFLAALSCLLACGGENHSVTAPSPTAMARSPIPPNPPPGPPTATLGASLGYCALEPTSSYQAPSLVVSVGFTDDDGRVGSLEATAIVIKP